jgi:hypothetical protein
VKVVSISRGQDTRALEDQRLLSLIRAASTAPRVSFSNYEQQTKPVANIVSLGSCVMHGGASVMPIILSPV